MAFVTSTSVNFTLHVDVARSSQFGATKYPIDGCVRVRVKVSKLLRPEIWCVTSYE